MATLGWHNPFPVEFGGGEALTEGIYRALLSAGGKGGAAEDEDGSIDGLWRQVRARAVAGAVEAQERAFLQAFPDRATDALGYYEDLLGLIDDLQSSDAERRARAAALFTGAQASDGPSLEQSLQALNAGFAVLRPSNSEGATTIAGRAFEDLAATEPFGGGRKSTAFPNYSTDFVEFILLDRGASTPLSEAEARAMTEARRICHEALPAWCDFQIATEEGFVLDESLLGLASL